MSPNRVDARQRLLDRALDLDSRRRAPRPARRLAGQLQVQRHLGAPADVEDVDVVDLADAAHAHRGRVGELARDRVLLDSARRGRRRPSPAAPARPRSSTASAAACPWPTAANRARRRSRRRRSAGPRPSASAAAAACTAGSSAAIARLRGRLGVGRRPVHQDVHVAAHQPQRRAQHERGDEQGGDRVGLAASPPARPTRPTSTASEPAKSLPKWSAFESSAALWKRRAVRSETSVRETSIASTKPMTTNAHQAASTLISIQPPSRATARRGDAGAHERERRRLEQRREMLGLAVAVLVLLVGRAAPRRRPRRTSGARRRGRCPSAAPPRSRPSEPLATPADSLRAISTQAAADRDERGSSLRAHPKD